ncbi:MAG TPA: efflux RND transporter periplasmic adaptor subunit [Methylomirabilota bacterium]|jgi:HlyD family secretion protein|nr:efflux RND transporter periplasmic adaptor subunit [Methylomirabilota bacterium]
MKRFISLAVVALLLGAGVWGYLYAQGRNTSPKYRLGAVERGPLTAAVSATGNLNAVTTVQVGSQVSGQIKELHADFNTRVKRGQVIARLDPEIFQAKVNQARAEVETANAAVLNQAATVEKARADVENARAALAQAKALTAKADAAQADSKRAADRNAELFRRQLIAQADRDTAQANYDQAIAQSESSRASEKAFQASIQSAQAQLRVQEASLKSATAQVKQRQAMLRQAEVDLEHATITAPVDGVVVSRQVDVGQTVAASLQAPTLFTIAQDLTKMQVETSVDEADIGRIKVEDAATFTVDAFSGQTFTGTVTQIRKAPLVVQNVVTYTVVISVANPGERLLPGMTANVKLVYAEKPNVLKVPNAALRFRPAGAEAGPPPPGRGVPGGGQPAGGERGGGGRGAAMRERLVTGLGLDAAQQKQLDAILADASQPRETTRAKIREILTPAQQAKYDEMAAARGGAGASGGGGTPGRVFVLDNDGKPKAVSLVLGISDGSATEIVRGELKEGQEVITGAAGAAQPGRPGTSGPRLRL